MFANNKLLIVTLIFVITGILNVSDASANKLTGIEVKKSGNDTVNFTLYSSNPSAGNVMVRKKSDNKYVILIPNTTSEISAPNFSGAKDLISSIDLKTVNDTSDGYTKVTVVTKNPININTRTVETKPVTQEQIAYRTLLQEINTPKKNSIPTVSKPTPSMEGNLVVQPSNSTVAKSNNTKSNVTESKKTINTDNKVDSANSVKPTVQNQKNLNNIDTSSSIVIQKEKTSIESENNKYLSPIAESKVSGVSDSSKKLIDNNKTFYISKIKQKIKSITAGTFTKNELPQLPEIPSYIQFAFGGVILLYLLKKLSAKKSKINTESVSFDSKFDNQDSPVGTVNNKYAAITGNNKLNWRDKYKMYNEAVENPEIYENEKNKLYKNLKYSFINVQKVKKKREHLEEMYQTNPKRRPDLYSEGDSISNSLKFIKNDSSDFKSTNIQQRPIKRFKRYETAEQQTINIGMSKLNKNMRKFKDSALNVFDVLPKSKSIKELRRIEESKKQDFVMSSLDEFFSVMDEKPYSNPSAAKSEQMIKPENYHTIKMISRVKMPQENNIPEIDLTKAYSRENDNGIIKSNSSNKKESKLSISSSYDIDDDHSFYIVNLEGKSALVARSGEDITVLKQFDTIINKNLQVRKDREDVYMVKTEGFKSLVEVNNNGVGVLIEL